jgi:hypothetical protein
MSRKGGTGRHRSELRGPLASREDGGLAGAPGTTEKMSKRAGDRGGRRRATKTISRVAGVVR